MYNTAFIFVSHIFLTLTLGWYVINNLQWYNYKIERVIFKHKRYTWHIFFFMLPLFAYYLTGIYFWIFFYFGLLPSFFVWHKKLDKKLVFTGRVKRFFVFLFLSTLFQNILCVLSQKCMVYGLIMPLFVTLGISYLFERILYEGYKKEALKKLSDTKDMKIVAITASYGKTSIKNFLFQILEGKKNVYMTPRSVNTEGGLMKDINDDLPEDTEVYIAEAGAREKGDIAKISKLLNHQYAIVGKVGPQHIEYFKTLENIRNTKMEIISSKKLQKALVHKSANISPSQNIIEFGDEVSNVESNLDGIAFDMKVDEKIHHIEAPVLGGFNAFNISAAVLMALELGIDMDTIKEKVKTLKQVDHRLQKMEAGGKLIIDDSYNGNLEGMKSSYDMAASYEGRRVLVTPGVIESTKEANIELAKKIDEVFDIVIITGKENSSTLYANIKSAKRIILSNKEKMQDTLVKETRAGDLILFSNDAPTFI